VTRAVRRPALDVLKGAAIVFVVLNHALVWPMRSGDQASALLYGTAFWTVAAYTAVAGWVRGTRVSEPSGAALARRARQLLTPWVFWAPLYAAAPLVWRLIGGGELPIGFAPREWFVAVALGGGPLWFLPVLLVVQAVCEPWVERHDGWAPALLGVGAYGALAALGVARGEGPLALGSGTFWAVAPLYVPAFWCGVRFARRPASIGQGALAWTAAVTTLASGAVTYARYAAGGPHWLMWVPYALGLAGGCALLALAAGASAAPDAGRGLLARAGRVSLGVYVLHPAFLAPAELVLHGRGGAMGALVATALTVVLAVVVAEWARRRPVLCRVM